MSSLVSDFIINPVLRQARRFSEISRSTFISDGEEPTSQPQNTIDENSPAQRPEPIPDFTSTVESPITRPLSVPARESDVVYNLPGPIMAETSSVRSRSNLSPPGSKKLPEDDGMGQLRSRIQAINAQEISANDKARLMHDTLLEGYRATRTVTHTRVHSHGGETYVSTLEQSPSQPLKFWQNSGDAPSSERFQLSEKDLKPTRVPVKQSKHNGHDPNDSPEPLLEEDQPFGCAHYERNVKLQCSTCKKWYTCRFCHDADEDHNLIRPETKNMLCMLCGTPQKASDVCVGCGEIAAHYYCNICKLWENRPSKPIYHCNDCGICRKGMGLGKDFFHCKTCRACISTSIESTHKCIERSTECDCPICGEYLFTSPRPVVFMPCGHSIHKKCYEAHMKVSYKCPICNKSLTNMESQFRNLDVAIQTQPMPSEFQDTTAVVLCNDCSGRSTVRYHWLGLKCSICRSYNTVELQILGPDDRRVQPTIAETGEAVNAAVVPPAVLDDGPTPAATVATRAIAATGRRRHSSHGIEAQIEFPDRVARSLSPLNLGFDSIMGLLTHDGDSDDDILGIWRGRDLGGDRGSNHGDEMDSDGDLSDVVSDSDEDDDEEEEDDVNEISLYGHR